MQFARESEEKAWIYQRREVEGADVCDIWLGAIVGEIQSTSAVYKCIWAGSGCRRYVTSRQNAHFT